jgi:ubiquinone/menaquinone biosynthesis C-methylase UbiE
MNIRKLIATYTSKKRVADVMQYYAEWNDRYIQAFGDTFQSHRPEDLPGYFKYLSHQLNLHEGMSVLDAGCGIGGPMFGIAGLNPACSFVGLNVSEEQLKIIEKKKIETGAINTDVQKGDFHLLDQIFAPEAFDRVYFLESLVHAQNTEQVIQGVYHALKPYGKIYIKDLFERTAISADDERKIKESVKVNNKLFRMTIIKKEEVLMLLRKYGFKLDYCKLLEIEANQEVGNRFVIENNIVTDVSDWHPYLEWYEIRATKVMSVFD